MHLVYSFRALPINQNVRLTFVRCSYSRALGAEAIVDVSIAGESTTGTTKKTKQCTEND
jgi:hypothetical protein